MFLRSMIIVFVVGVLSACATDPVIEKAKSELESIPSGSVVSQNTTECKVSSKTEAVEVLTKYAYSGKWSFGQFEGEVAAIFEERAGELLATYGGEDGTRNWVWGVNSLLEPVTFTTPTEFSWQGGGRSLTLLENCRLEGESKHSNGSSDLYLEPARIKQ